MIFITGGTGFLGSYILQELVLQGKSVRALRRNRSFPFYLDPGIEEKISWVNGDILDVDGLLENLTGCTQIIHAAGLVSFNPADKNDLYKFNIEGTANLVNAALETGISDFIHVSSVGALGRNADATPTDEETKWVGNRGQSSYGISKYYGEMEVWRGMGEGLTPLVVNPSTLLGYGDWNQTSCSLFKTAYHEFPWYMEGSNGFCDVRDAARAIVSLMNGSIRNERFVLTAENRSYLEIFTWMAKGFSKKPPTRKANSVMANLAWRMEGIRSVFTRHEPLITKETVAIAEKKSVYNNQKLLKAVPDFQFRSLEDSIYEACIKYTSRPG